jgi:protein-tyrosine phosphatase
MNAIPSYVCAGIYLSDWRTACLIDYEDVSKNYNIGLVITAMTADEVDYYGIEASVDFKGAAWSWLAVQDDDAEPIGGHFKDICQAIDAVRAEGKAVLIHCMAGVSRSPTLVAAYLMHNRRITAAEALGYLKERRACVDPNAGFRHQLLAWEAELEI